ncbi:unnamed protein product [Lactuca virosa]|uniref:Uncharacterized protein n=1 Tax=Lactuca virosa TaxID=75947 RepID=A0AAU9LXW6_9ASTR|nr:unnamed protein product [Lactuca virosa]
MIFGMLYFARECKSKKKIMRGKYMQLLASLMRKNIDVKILVAKVENWVDDEESSDKDGRKDTCLMAYTDVPVTDKESIGFITFKADLAKVTKDSKKQD